MIIQDAIREGECIKYIEGEDTLKKIQDRYVLFRKCDNLNYDEKIILLCVLYTTTKENVEILMKKHIEEDINYKNRKDLTKEKMMKVFWIATAGSEGRDWKHWLRYGPQSVRGTKEYYEDE